MKQIYEFKSSGNARAFYNEVNERFGGKENRSNEIVMSDIEIHGSVVFTNILSHIILAVHMIAATIDYDVILAGDEDEGGDNISKVLTKGNKPSLDVLKSLTSGELDAFLNVTGCIELADYDRETDTYTIDEAYYRVWDMKWWTPDYISSMKKLCS